jgi:membrane-associated phospholipid phosphatase
VKCSCVAALLQLLIAVPLASQSQHPRWWEAALVVGTIGAATLADRGLNGWIQSHRSPGGDDVARVFKNGGEPEVTFGIGGGILAAGVIAGRPALRRSGGRVLLSLVAAGVTTAALKKVTGRLRPAESTDPFLFKPFSSHDAFPSGHTTMAFALATSLSAEIRNRWASAALYTFATGTAWSRMNDERHWLSDVLAGAAVGFAAARIIERHPPRFLADRDGVKLEWRLAF